ncbi:hypothetical protein CO038_02475 [Candidatus Pacearchaeota archaeon CG_4_9_14_0_2_um_filter_39_13]|nr:hypothetical protein [Candidatus Pacearchaeota archaeon]OIO43952.1 MAG: hypothetical protein AUJ64_01530 [Candidatus Pacearchaeota archaeon CG1_02_39_14]PJC44805.1 MAG: hypothetical protein CO038_02475 [Candidatus Pacearchaeota archaeon CG_4_9_14_0_2_um_filter_39_13]
MQEIITSISEFLGIVLADNSFVYLEIWSIVHFFSGAILMYPIWKYFDAKRDIRRGFIFLFFLLALWEAFEFILYGEGIIRPEGGIDVVWDLIIGMLGGVVYWIFVERAGSGIKRGSARSDRGFVRKN